MSEALHPARAADVSLLSACADDIRAGRRTSTDVTADYLDRIRALEPSVHAFAWFDAAAASAAAAESDRVLAAHGPLGPLHGVPVGVKDIIDTKGIPTECGTPWLAGRTPDRSATVVSAIEAAGANVIGKTVTAELAFAAPGPTRNPWNHDRTPGGSSMGSAAAVAAGMLPGAIGTQTNSSVIMPAALCGAVGFKPTTGSLPLDGVLAFSPTFDQLGCFARSVGDVALLAGAMGLRFGPQATSADPALPPVLVVARTSEWSGAAEPVRAQFEQDLVRLARAGATLVEAPAPEGLDDARVVHRVIMAYEAARALRRVVAGGLPALSGVLRRFLAEGEGIPPERYEQALSERRALVDEFALWAGGYDAVVTPAAPDEAPSCEGTGDPRFCTRWSLVGAPALVIPAGVGPNGLPIGLQFVGAPGADVRLLAAAAWVERLYQPLGEHRGLA